MLHSVALVACPSRLGSHDPDPEGPLVSQSSGGGENKMLNEQIDLQERLLGSLRLHLMVMGEE